MSSIPKEINPRLAAQIVAAVPAANADDLGDQAPLIVLTEGASGWDSYEVWRRFIKDARNRRLSEHK